MSAIKPLYPEIAQEAGIEGVVVVQAFIDAKGRVKQTLILKGVPNTGLDGSDSENAFSTSQTTGACCGGLDIYPGKF